MTFTAQFGAVQTALGYQFFDAGMVLLGTRVTSGISTLGTTGIYSATATPPTGAVGIYWNDTVSGAYASDEIAASGLSTETAAALEAADQILLANLYVPDEAPAVVIPAPSDPDLVSVYVHTEDIVGEALTSEVITITLTSPFPAVSSAGKVVSNSPRTMEHQSGTPGLYQIELETGLRYRVENTKLFGPNGQQFTAAGATLNLATV